MVEILGMVVVLLILAILIAIPFFGSSDQRLRLKRVIKEYEIDE